MSNYNCKNCNGIGEIHCRYCLYLFCEICLSEHEKNCIEKREEIKSEASK